MAHIATGGFISKATLLKSSGIVILRYPEGSRFSIFSDEILRRARLRMTLFETFSGATLSRSFQLSPLAYRIPIIATMSLVSDRCICLRKVEYSETSQILLLFGRSHGLNRVIAKGAHRVTKTGASKFGGGIDLLDLGNAVFTHRPEKDLATLTEWKLRDGHLDLRKTLRGMHLSFYAAELVSLLIEEHDPHPELFDRLEAVLLELAGPRVEQAFLAFELDLLRETGYLPSMNACISCGAAIDARNAAAFDSARGGVLCRNCEGSFPHRLPIEGRLIGIVQYVLELYQGNGSLRRLPNLTRAQTDPINRLLAEYIEHTLGKRLKMPKYILGRREALV